MTYQAPELVLVGAARTIVQADIFKTRFRDSAPEPLLSRNTPPV